MIKSMLPEYTKLCVPIRVPERTTPFPLSAGWLPSPSDFTRAKHAPVSHFKAYNFAHCRPPDTRGMTIEIRVYSGTNLGGRVMKQVWYY